MIELVNILEHLGFIETRVIQLQLAGSLGLANVLDNPQYV
jgi:hypothetical protein